MSSATCDCSRNRAVPPVPPVPKVSTRDWPLKERTAELNFYSSSFQQSHDSKSNVYCEWSRVLYAPTSKEIYLWRVLSSRNVMK
eukprot:2686707-Rhodomonas_salina.1